MKEYRKKKILCVTCNKEIILDEHGMSDEQPLYLVPYGGYSDMYDSFVKEEDNIISFCHMCGHRILRLMGKGIMRHINPLSTTSHVRPTGLQKNDDNTVSLWHFGWDNVTLRGYISAMWHYFRINRFKGVAYAFGYLFMEQNFSKLNKSVNDPYPTNFNIGCLRIPKWYGIRVTDKIRRRGI
jgi:hypothetical protein